MRILADEDSQARAQLRILRAEGHDVLSVGDLDKNGTPDAEVFDLAQSLERVLLTHNTEDFRELHVQRPFHQGVMAVYRDDDPRKNMSHGEIAAAILRLERSRLPIAGDFHILNRWR